MSTAKSRKGYQQVPDDDGSTKRPEEANRVLDEQERLKYDNEQLDAAFKACLNAMALLVIPIAAIYTYHAYRAPSVPAIAMDTSSHPYPRAAPIVTLGSFMAFAIAIMLNIRRLISNSVVQMLLVLTTAVSAGIFMLQAVYGYHDSEIVYWGVSVTVWAGFLYSWYEMEGAGQQVKELERLKYKLKEDQQAAEEKIINEEYKLWKKNTPFLYDLVVSHAFDWPSLTVQWLPDKEEPEGKGYTVQRLLLGTHTNGSEQNYLQVATVQLPKVPTALDPHKYDEETREVGGYGEVSCKINIQQKIPHDGEINRARYMPQKPNLVATKTVSGDVYLFDLTKFPYQPPPNATCNPSLKLKGHTAEGYGLAWSNLKTGHIISSGNDGLVCHWDVQQMQRDQACLDPMMEYQGHQVPVGDVAWHCRNEKIFASVGDDGRLLIWDTGSGSKPTLNVQAHNAEVNCVAFSPATDTMLCTGSSDKTVALWDLRNMKERLHTLESHTDMVVQVAWSPHCETILATAGADRRVMVWDLSRIGDELSSGEAQDGPPELLFIHGGHTNKVGDFAWNPHDPWVLCSAADDNIVQVWQMSSKIYMDADEDRARRPPRPSSSTYSVLTASPPDDSSIVDIPLSGAFIDQQQQQESFSHQRQITPPSVASEVSRRLKLASGKQITKAKALLRDVMTEAAADIYPTSQPRPSSHSGQRGYTRIAGGDDTSFASSGENFTPVRHSRASSIANSLHSYVYPQAPWRSDTTVSRREILRALANRVMFSGFYKVLYLSMTALAFISVFLSYHRTCPKPGSLSAFITVEIIINAVMIIEVSIRAVAMGKAFWAAKSNWLDVGLVFLCAVTLLLLLSDGCNDDDKGRNREAVADSILLIVRNLIQLVRIFHMLRKNQQNYNAYPADIDFNDAHSDAVSFDIDTDPSFYPGPSVVVDGMSGSAISNGLAGSTLGSEFGAHPPVAPVGQLGAHQQQQLKPPPPQQQQQPASGYTSASNLVLLPAGLGYNSARSSIHNVDEDEDDDTGM
ncbi:Histone acetyltransferase type B subunit 2 [Sorochytrium milnesiophthora]